MFTRLLLTFVGLACASAAAPIFLPIAIIFDPLVQQIASHVPADHWFDILSGLVNDEDPEETIGTLFQLVWTVGMLVCVAPVTITALIGGVSGARSQLFYAGLSGLLAAAMPWVLRASRFAERGIQASSAETHLTAMLFLTGAVAGLVYWLIAARSAADPPRRGWASNQTSG